ncbi:hypothetical protein BDV27DRAFT_152096 [Aspergillus caelatus]|uniref:Uncharacterized protein n=1 Tax=Aspergillus caelatus TaxID=61420 RepID=A0A5N7AKT5_9EURO|nr:uncharacterized protein BDV27DRAFT_152096 [Aspergillus caelatus]KAE8370502.1 hypothetical protein BDV27DRAFT_152096 [Aspergillus caelatus]
MAEVQQDQQYRLLLHLFFSEKPLDINVTSDSCITNVDEVVSKNTTLKRFHGYKDEFIKTVFIGKGKQEVAFRFEQDEKDLCLKLDNIPLPSSELMNE